MSSKHNFLPKFLYKDGQIINIKDVWFLSLAHDAYQFYFQVPLEKCVWGYGWRYTQAENPLYSVYNCEDNLDKFYQNYQPKSALEALTLEVNDGGWNSLSLPWCLTINPLHIPVTEPYRQTMSSQVGPVNPNKLELEKTRFQQVFTSIETVGYQGGQGEHGHIRGYFMIHHDDFVFHITAGKHQAAAFLKLGYLSVPATFNIFVPRMPRLISHQHLELLAGKGYATDMMTTVYQIFESYFDEVLRQRRISYLASWLGQSSG